MIVSPSQFVQTILVFAAALLLYSAFPDRPTRERSAATVERRTLPLHRPYYQVRTTDLERSSPGTTLIPVSGPEEVLLLDHTGGLLHSWPVDSDRSLLLPGCRLLALHGTKTGLEMKEWKKLRTSARVYSAGGDVLWSLNRNGWLHHDVSQIGDKTVLIEQERVPYRGRAQLPESFQLKSDTVIVTDHEGRVLWEWRASEHFHHDFCGRRRCPTSRQVRRSRDLLKQRRDWTHMNTARVLPLNRRHREGDERFQPGNILVHLRNFWSSYLINRDSGEIVWQFPPRGTPKDSPLHIYAGHETHMIEEGFPGAGNILIFDNGDEQKRPYSRVLEIDPTTFEIVWSYEEPERFFSRVAGSVQRLKNGNTLISSDARGRIFEVTPSKETVWEVDFPFRTGRAKRYSNSLCQRQH